MAEFLDLKNKRDLWVFGVPIQSRDISTLKEFSDEIIQIYELLDAETEPLLEYDIILIIKVLIEVPYASDEDRGIPAERCSSTCAVLVICQP